MSDPTQEQHDFYRVTHCCHYGHNPRRCVEPDTGCIRGGIERGIMTEISAFEYHWPDVVEWGIRIITHLSECRVYARKRPHHETVASWEQAKAIIEAHYKAAWETDLAEAQEWLDNEPDDYMKHGEGRESIVDGKVTDPWGKDMSGPCQWFIDRLCVFNIWCVYQRVKDLVDESVSYNLGMWADNDRDGANIAKVATNACDDAMQGLSDYIDKLALAQVDAKATDES